MKHDVVCRRCDHRTTVRFDDAYCTEFECACGRRGLMRFYWKTRQWQVTAGFRPVDAMASLETQQEDVGRGVATTDGGHPLEEGR